VSNKPVRILDAEAGLRNPRSTSSWLSLFPFRLCNPPAADHQITVVKHDGLAGCDGALWLVEHSAYLAVGSPHKMRASRNSILSAC
jgi:hypothetical protein